MRDNEKALYPFCTCDLEFEKTLNCSDRIDRPRQNSFTNNPGNFCRTTVKNIEEENKLLENQAEMNKYLYDQRDELQYQVRRLQADLEALNKWIKRIEAAFNKEHPDEKTTTPADGTITIIGNGEYRKR